MKKHFVTFYSPGTFMAEDTTKPIDSWDVDKAIEMSREVVERYKATPYGFRFSTRERGEDDLDSKTVALSHLYFLGGEVFTLAQLKEKSDPRDSILISNMESNKWDRVVVNGNSWQWTQPLEEEDVVLEFQK